MNNVIPDTTSAYVILPTRVPTTEMISEAVWDERVKDHILSGSAGEIIRNTGYAGSIWIDTVGGTAGTDPPIGMPFTPVNNLADAITIANTTGINRYVKDLGCCSEY